jgi:hypothetical protein
MEQSLELQATLLSIRKKLVIQSLTGVPLLVSPQESTASILIHLVRLLMAVLELKDISTLESKIMLDPLLLLVKDTEVHKVTSLLMQMEMLESKWKLLVFLSKTVLMTISLEEVSLSMQMKMILDLEVQQTP